MGLTIRMKIDEHDEHTYVYNTGDGGEIELIPLSVVLNGEYQAPEGKAYNLVSVNVPLPDIESLNITENGSYVAEDGTVWNVVNVDVPNTYLPADEGKVVQSGALVGQTTKNITYNGTFDTTTNNSCVVDVPAPEPSLEHLVESITENGTYTYNPSTGFDGFADASISVSVSGGGGNQDVVKGTFQATSLTNNFEVSIPYTGTKKLQYLIVCPTSGIHAYISDTNYNSSTILGFVVYKRTLDAPTYNTNTVENQAVLMRIYKNSTTGSTVNTTNTAILYHATNQNDYSSATGLFMHIKNNTTVSMATRGANSGTSRYAIEQRIEYTYYAIYQ